MMVKKMNIIPEDRFNEILDCYQKIGPILVVGDVGIDKYIIGKVKRISPEAPVPVVEVIKEKYKLGMAANITNNLESLNIKSTLCGVVGNDANGEFFKKIMRENNIDPCHIVSEDNRSTICKERVTTAVQQICRVDYETQEPISYESEQKILSVASSLVESHGALIIEDYSKGTLSENLNKGLIEIFRNRGKIVAVDPGRQTSPEFYSGASLLKPNLFEAELMSRALGCRSNKIDDMAYILIDKLNLDMLIITLGGDGMAYIEKNGDGKINIVPVVQTEVYDVSGAGDTSISVITASLLAGSSLREAVCMGNYASGVVVGKFGTATVSTSELQMYYQRYLLNRSVIPNRQQ